VDEARLVKELQVVQPNRAAARQRLRSVAASGEGSTRWIPATTETLLRGRERCVLAMPDAACRQVGVRDAGAQGCTVVSHGAPGRQTRLVDIVHGAHEQQAGQDGRLGALEEEPVPALQLRCLSALHTQGC
jgi:hypothetical protein